MLCRHGPHRLPATIFPTSPSTPTPTLREHLSNPYAGLPPFPQVSAANIATQSGILPTSKRRYLMAEELRASTDYLADLRCSAADHEWSNGGSGLCGSGTDVMVELGCLKISQNLFPARPYNRPTEFNDGEHPTTTTPHSSRTIGRRSDNINRKETAASILSNPRIITGSPTLP